MYLVDTNVWLEHLLNQARAQEAKQFVTGVDASLLFLSDFSLHSICLIFGRSKQFAALDQFFDDLFIHAEVTVLSVPPNALKTVTVAMQSQQLDFDDAYQYVIAKRDRLTLVSFDADFDRSDLERKTPAQVLASQPPSQS